MAPTLLSEAINVSLPPSSTIGLQEVLMKTTINRREFLELAGLTSAGLPSAKPASLALLAGYGEKPPITC